MFKNILGEGNYFHAKALSAVGKALLVKGEIEKAEETFRKAQDLVSVKFGASHPLVVKRNADLVEAINMRPETPERGILLNQICEKNVEVLRELYGEGSIYLIRPMYTLYTAKLHEKTTAGADRVITEMVKLEHEGKAISDN